jgi:ankyrin repeat protein
MSPSVRDQQRPDYAQYAAHARPAEVTVTRLVIGLVLLLVCAIAPMLLGGYLWRNSTVSRFAHAVRRGDIASVRAMVTADASLVDAPGYLGRRPLWWAATTGHTGIMELLLNRGAVINSRDAAGFTPLLAAAKADQAKSMDLLYWRKADMKAVDTQGRNALLVAATGPNLTVAKYLMKLGFLINATDTAGNTAMHIAVVHQQLGVLTYLIGQGAAVNVKNADGATPLRLAHSVARKDENIIDALMNAGGEM